MSSILRTEGIVKKFGNLVANDHIDFEIYPGELHCLVGENGAGKSTLLNILYGVWRPDGGKIVIKGKDVKINSTHDAIVKYKIGKVSQHFDLVPSFTVIENIMFRELPRKNKIFLDKETMRDKVADLLNLTGYKVNLDAVVETLSVGEQQQVEILKVLAQDSEIIFLDEPSSLLAPQEFKELFALLKVLLKKGRTIVLVTHKLDEVLACDRITVLRNGKVVLKGERKTITQEDLLESMFDKEIQGCQQNQASILDRKSRPLLEVCDLCTEKTGRSGLEDVSFVLREGEIFGIAGVVGNGQTELLDCLAGFRSPTKGKLLVNGKDVTQDWKPSRYRRENSLAYVPEGRREMGSFLKLAITENLILGEGRRPFFFSNYIRKQALIDSFSNEMVSEYDIETEGIHSLAGSLSGGNLQKMILSRELSLDLGLLIAAHPSRGLDFKTTEYVHTRLCEKKAQGKGILLVSSDLDEIMKLSDRIAVMYEGKLTLVHPEEANIDKIGRIMVGADEINRKTEET